MTRPTLCYDYAAQLPYYERQAWLYRARYHAAKRSGDRERINAAYADWRYAGALVDQCRARIGGAP